MYRVEIHRKAEKEIKELPKKIMDRVIELMVKLQKVPYPFREYDLRKLQGFKDVYRIRIGEYRVTYRVNDENKKITILEVKIRGKAYDDIRHRMA